MSEEIKMSDVFELPICRDANALVSSESTCYLSSFGCNDRVRGAIAKYAAHAINVHDKNQETIAQLKTERDKTISVMSKSWQHEPHGDELIYNHTKTLLDSIERKDETITKQAEEIKSEIVNSNKTYTEIKEELNSPLIEYNLSELKGVKKHSVKTTTQSHIKKPKPF